MEPNAIHAALAAARPQAVGALLRYFRDLDKAEDAFQDASIRALKTWPEKGLPRDPAAWLILVGRNAALDQVRRQSRQVELPDEQTISELGDAETDVAERIDHGQYPDDVLRLLFICCHPDLPANQQIALALRIVSGLSVKEIARAFLVSEAAMEQRITRAKRRIGESGVAYETPGPQDRAKRLQAVCAMLYLVFNEGYAATGGELHVKASLCDEAVRLAKLLLRLFPEESEVKGLAALMLLQHARTPSRLDANNAIVLLEHQDRNLWNAAMIEEGRSLVRQALAQRRLGPYQIQAAIAAVHADAPSAEKTDWEQIERLYGLLQNLQPSPVVALNRAVAVAKLHGPGAALAMIDPLGEDLPGYFYYYGVRGALLKQMRRFDEARSALQQALGLANSQAEADHIRKQIAELEAEEKAGPA